MSKTQTEGIYGHFNIGLTFLRAMIEENGNHAYIVTGQGISLTKGQALKWIDKQMNEGIEYVSPGCPTPKPNGACPLHSRGDDE